MLKQVEQKAAQLNSQENETNNAYLTATKLAVKNELSSFERKVGPDHLALDFIVPTLHCGGCMSKIEGHFNNQADGITARVNLGAKRVHFEWPRHVTNGALLAAELDTLGFKAEPLLETEAGQDASQRQFKKLVWCLGVAGFAAANVMLLSVSVWSGASGATRDLFHWISALIALPAIVYAGQPFFSSAMAALKAHRLNMDVPISLAVILASAISLYETMTHGEHAFFDAAITLLFFLLIGRTLDQLMRAKAHASAGELLALRTKTATIVNEQGKTQVIAIRDIKPGMAVLVRPGETIPVDGRIIEGASDINWSLVTGESIPRQAKVGDKVYSGLLNTSGLLKITTQEVGDQTLLAEIVRLMEQAETRSPTYRKLADRAAAIYAPAVHIIAALTFLGWLIAGAGWQAALFTAISVLIITCPCALGLAVPVVQVVASGIAFKLGILMKDGAALEKLSEIDTIVFDKTGTLTLARPILKAGNRADYELYALGLGLAKTSLHPLSKALVEAGELEGQVPLPVANIKEHPGLGLEGTFDGKQVRLGSKEWCGIDDETVSHTDGLKLWVSYKDSFGIHSSEFCFEDEVRAGVKQMINDFQRNGIEVHILSGDREETVAMLSNQLGITHFQAETTPKEKADYIESLNKAGAKVLMVGDGINDGPALKIAHVSLSPACASDVAQVSAGFVMLGDRLRLMRSLYKLSKGARNLIWQNFALALIYNIIAVPIAVLGGATPIVAAIAMSVSSLVVTLNGLRLRLLVSTRWDKP